MADSIETQITNQVLIAQELAAQATTSLAVLEHVNTPFTPNLGVLPDIGIVPDTATLATPPDANIRPFIQPTAPTAPILADVMLPTQPDFPVDNTGTQPELLLPDVPAQLGALAVTIPTIADVGTLDTLDVDGLLSGITAPVATALNLPSKPTLTMPDYTVAPAPELPTAPDLTGRFERAYTYAASLFPADVMTRSQDWFNRWFPNHGARLLALENRLTAWLRGDFLFDDSVADAITGLTRDQIDAEYSRSEQDAIEGPGKRGYTYPDSVMAAALTVAADKRADAHSRSAMDLRKTRFEYQQKMLEFAVSQAKDLCLGSMQIFVSVFQGFATLNGQAIDYAKESLAALVQVFNLQVEAYKAAQEGRRLEAEVYRARIQAALALLDVYRAELEAEKLKVDVDDQRVRLYEARLRAVNAYIDAYKTKASIVEIRANVERLKLEAASEKVKLYTAITGAKEAEYRGYAAQIGGQEALQRAWAERVRARTAELEGYKTRIEALNEGTKILLSYNESLTRRYEADTNVFRALTDAERIAVETDLQTFKATTDATTARNSAVAERARLALAQWQAGRDIVLKRGDQNIAKAKAEADVKNANLNLQATVAQAQGHILGAIAQAALAGINSVLSKSVTQST